MSRLWIRADANPAIGLGHVMRTLSLAEEAAARGIPVTYASVTGDLVRGIAADRSVDLHELADPQDRSWTTRVGGDDIVVFDGYHLGEQDHDGVRSRRARVAVVDDDGRRDLGADVIINPNLVSADLYAGLGSIVLVGPAHALVRREFQVRRRSREPGTELLLVTLGGADTAGAAPLVLQAVEQSPFRSVTVLLGPAARELDIPLPPKVRPLRTRDVAATFDTADAVLAAAGSTTWELLTMGLPVALVQTAPNQVAVGEPAAMRGAALFGGEVAAGSTRLHGILARLGRPTTQRSLMQSGMALVDGLGAARVLDALRA